MREAVLVDTSAFHALRNAGDVAEHEAAKKAAQALEAEGVVLVTTDYVLDESYTLLRLILGHEEAVRFGQAIQGGGIEVVQVDAQLQRHAWHIFERYSDKNFSFTDCASFAVMELGRIRRAFTFDRHFEQYGFTAYPAMPRPRRRTKR